MISSNPTHSDNKVIILLGTLSSHHRKKRFEKVMMLSQWFSIPILVSGLELEIEHYKQLFKKEKYSGEVYYRATAFDTVSNRRDIMDIFSHELEDLYLHHTNIELLVTSSPSHLRRFGQIQNILNQTSKQYKKFSITPQTSGEGNAKYEPYMYWIMRLFGRLGVVGLSVIAYLTRSNKYIS